MAIALFAGSITAILALLPGLSRRANDAADRLAAQRLPDAVRLEMTRLATPGLDALAAKIPVMGQSFAEGYTLVATRKGARIQSRDEPSVAVAIATEDRYFRAECWRFADAPLRFDNGQPVLALCVRVSWPYQGISTPPVAASGEFMFVVSLNQ